MRYFPAPKPDTRKHWSPNRNRTGQDRFRRAVIALYGNACTICGATPVQAHHTQPGNDDPRTGRPLCQAHHRVVDPHAR